VRWRRARARSAACCQRACAKDAIAQRDAARDIALRDMRYVTMALDERVTRMLLLLLPLIMIWLMAYDIAVDFDYFHFATYLPIFSACFCHVYIYLRHAMLTHNIFLLIFRHVYCCHDADAAIADAATPLPPLMLLIRCMVEDYLLLIR